jgi:hypothetical protein
MDFVNSRDVLPGNETSPQPLNGLLNLHALYFDPIDEVSVQIFGGISVPCPSRSKKSGSTDCLSPSRLHPAVAPRLDHRVIALGNSIVRRNCEPSIATAYFRPQMPPELEFDTDTPRNMKAHQISPGLLLTRPCAPAARNRRRSSRLFIVYYWSRLLPMRKLAWWTHLWSASDRSTSGGAIAPPRRTISAFPEKRPRYAFVRR